MSSENPTPASASYIDLIHEQAILREFLDTTNIDCEDNDNNVSSVCSVCSNCKHPPKKKERTLNVVHTFI